MASKKHAILVVFTPTSTFWRPCALSTSTFFTFFEWGFLVAKEFMKGLHFQMKYVLPVITAVVSYTLISVVGLYWIVGNIFATLQEIYFRGTIKKKAN